MYSKHSCGCVGECHCHEKRAGKGTTALGIVGTVLGGAALLGEGVLGGRGLFGGRRHGYDDYGYDGHHGHRDYMLDKCSCLVDKYELGQAEKISALESRLEEQRAEKYAIERDECLEGKIDHISIKAQKSLDEVCALHHELEIVSKKDSEIAALKDKIVEEKLLIIDQKLNGKIDLVKAEADCCCQETRGMIRHLSQDVAKEFECTKSEFRGALALESERRSCGDKELYEYVTCRYVPGERYIPESHVGHLECCGGRRRRRGGLGNDDDANIIFRGNHNTVSPTYTNTPTVSGDDDTEGGINN